MLTAPVRNVASRLHPDWLNALMVALPTLAVLGSQAGRPGVIVFRVAVLALLAVATVDWWRHRDRSRTGWAVWGLAAMFLLSALVSIALQRPDLTAARRELVALGILFAGALALVQLYRGRPTLIGLCRGWLLALSVIFAGYLAGVLSPGVPAEGDPTQWFPDVAQLIGAICAALLFLPIGVAIEPKRWVRASYLAILPLTAILALVPPGPTLLHRAWSSLRLGSGPGEASPLDLLAAGWWMLRDSDFLGRGPGSFRAVLESGQTPFVVPWGVDAHWAVAEVMGEYGLGVTILTTLALMGLAKRGVQRLRRTAGLDLWSPERAPALWVLVVVALWPILSMAGADWVTQPVAGIQFATIACLARHLEMPRGRRPADAGEPDLT